MTPPATESEREVILKTIADVFCQSKFEGVESDQKNLRSMCGSIFQFSLKEC